MLVAGIYLFFIERVADPIWPWKPDLVSARVMAGFPLGWAAWAATLALAPTWGEARGGVLLNIVWLAAVFLSVIVFQARFDLRRRKTQLYAGSIAILSGVLSVSYVMQGM